MKKQLVAGLYLFVPEPGLFGLTCGQLRPPGHQAHNAGWFNDDGSRLGYGDLNEIDLLEISRGIDPEETFYVVDEEDSMNPRDSYGRLNPDEPGQAFIEDHAIFMIKRGCITFFDRKRDESRIKMIQETVPSVEIVRLAA